MVLVGVEKTVDFCMLKIWRWWHFILLGNQRFNWMWKGGISTHLIIMYVCSMCNVYGNVIYIFPKFAWLDRFNFVSRLHKTLHIICGIDISLLILISLFFFSFCFVCRFWDARFERYILRINIEFALHEAQHNVVACPCRHLLCIRIRTMMEPNYP